MEFQSLRLVRLVEVISRRRVTWTITAVLSVALAVGGYLLLVNRDKEKSPQAAAPSASTPPQQTSQVREAQIGEPMSRNAGLPQVSPSKSSAGSSGLDLFLEMNRADDLRRFVEAAKRTPGGAMYAVEALRECRAVRTMLPDPSTVSQIRGTVTSAPNSDARELALARLLKRCEGFTSDEMSIDEAAHVARTAREQRDRIASLAADVHRLSTKEQKVSERTELMKTALEMRDPIALKYVQSSLWILDASTPNSAVAFVDGKRFGGLDAEGYISAWRMASCAYLATCGVYDSQLLQACALEGVCAGDVASYVRSRAANDEAFGKIAATARLIQQILDSGELNRLMPIRP